jgi:hypothetical protein
MNIDLRRSVGRIPSIKKAKIAMVIQTAFMMTAIGGRFIIFSRKSNILLNSSAVLEAETEIIGPIRMVLECRLLIIVHRKSEIQFNFNSLFKTDYKTILCVRIAQVGSQMIVFCSADKVSANPFVIFKTMRKVI